MPPDCSEAWAPPGTLFSAPRPGGALATSHAAPLTAPVAPPLAAAAQIAGCVLGALLCTVLMPGVTVGMGAAGPGAWAPAAGLGAGAIFGWEALMTTFLCITVFGAAVAKVRACDCVWGFCVCVCVCV